MEAVSSEAHRHRARANKRFAAGALCAARERGGVDVCGLVCVCAFEKHAHLKDVAPQPVDALESLFRPCQLIEFTCSSRDASERVEEWGLRGLPQRLALPALALNRQRDRPQPVCAKSLAEHDEMRGGGGAERDSTEDPAQPPGQAGCEDPAAIELHRWPPPQRQGSYQPRHHACSPRDIIRIGLQGRGGWNNYNIIFYRATAPPNSRG